LLEENSSLKLIEFSNDKSTTNFININYNFDVQNNSILKNYKIDNDSNSNI